MTTKEKREAAEHAKEWLLAHLKPGDTISTCIRHVSRSGMSRSISAHIVRDGEIDDISGLLAHLLDLPMDYKRGGVKVAGCGMDMGFHLVYSASSVLFRDGWRCLGKPCHGTGHWRDDGKRVRKGAKHTDGGYALKQRWM